MSIYDEELNFNEPFELFDPLATWKRKTLTDYEVVDLLKPIFLNGELVYECPNIEEIKKYCKEQLDSLWDEVTRFENPHNYYVDLTQKLWDVKQQLLMFRRKVK